MNLGELRERFRQRADDLVEPYLWTTPEVDGYLNEAANEAAERGLLIYDDVSPHVTLLNGDPARKDYPLHESIIRIDRVVLADSGRGLTQADVRLLDAYGHWPDHKGRPLFYLIRGEKLIIYPRPNEHTRIRLGVYRLPKERMRNPDDRPEIEARWHERLIDWALYRAFSKPDADASNPGAADRALAAFAASFGDRLDADTQRAQQETRRPVAQMNSAWAGGSPMPAHYRRRGRY